MKLACAGALGFAFTENLLYFTEDKLNIIFVRGIVATMIHMITTCAVAYALVINRFRYKGRKGWLVAADVLWGRYCSIPYMITCCRKVRR